MIGWPDKKIHSSMNFRNPDDGAAALATKQAAGPPMCRQCEKGPGVGEAQLCRACWDDHYSHVHEHMPFDGQVVSSDSSDNEEQPQLSNRSNWKWQSESKWMGAPHDTEFLKSRETSTMRPQVTFAGGSRIQTTTQFAKDKSNSKRSCTNANLTNKQKRKKRYQSERQKRRSRK